MGKKWDRLWSRFDSLFDSFDDAMDEAMEEGIGTNVKIVGGSIDINGNFTNLRINGHKIKLPDYVYDKRK